jgi:His-Xaa-Ser system protein HxsD
LTKTILSVKVDLKTYSLDAVRYAAYTVSDTAFVMVREAGKSRVAVDLTAKTGKPLPGLKARFLTELADEKLREAVSDNNRELREFLVIEALAPAKKPASSADSGLTAEQEKELEELIAQVENEIKKDALNDRKKDPLEITKTWEDKYGGGKKRKK